MNRKNIGLTTPVIVIGGVIVIAIIAFFFVPGNAIHDAPVINKVISGLFAAGAAIWAIAFSKDKFTFSKDWKVNFFIHLGILAFLVVMAILFLAVFHSGPLGTTINPE